MLKKRKSHAFGKNVYLLGMGHDGIYYWLEEPSWDCGWYWGFGYVKTYTNNYAPSESKDITSHQHFDSLFLKGEWEAHKEFFKETTLTEKEWWTLKELMNTAYVLKEMAKIYRIGGSHIALNPCKKLLIGEVEEKHINETLLPNVFAEVRKLLIGGKDNEKI